MRYNVLYCLDIIENIFNLKLYKKILGQKEHFCFNKKDIFDVLTHTRIIGQ